MKRRDYCEYAHAFCRVCPLLGVLLKRLWLPLAACLIGILAVLVPLESLGLSVLEISPDGKQIAFGFMNGTISLYDLESGKIKYRFDNHGAEVFSMAFSPDGTKLLAGFFDGTATLWDTVSGVRIRTCPGNTRYLVSAVAFSPDGSEMLIGAAPDTLTLFDTETGKWMKSFTSSLPNSVAVSPDNRNVLSGGADCSARLWDMETGKSLQTFLGQPIPLFTGGGQKSISTSNQTIVGHTYSIQSARFSPDGSKILTSSLDGTAKVWDVATGSLIHTLSGHTDWVYSAIFSTDGTQALTGSFDGSVKLWDVASGKEIRSYDAGKSGVSKVLFLPDGVTIAAANLDGSTMLWNKETGECILKFTLAPWRLPAIILLSIGTCFWIVFILVRNRGLFRRSQSMLPPEVS